MIVTLAHPIEAAARSLPPISAVRVRALPPVEAAEVGPNAAARLFRQTGLSPEQQRALHPADLRAIIHAITRLNRPALLENF